MAKYSKQIKILCRAKQFLTVFNEKNVIIKNSGSHNYSGSAAFNKIAVEVFETPETILHDELPHDNIY